MRRVCTASPRVEEEICDVMEQDFMLYVENLLFLSAVDCLRWSVVLSCVFIRVTTLSPSSFFKLEGGGGGAVDVCVFGWCVMTRVLVDEKCKKKSSSSEEKKKPSKAHAHTRRRSPPNGYIKESGGRHIHGHDRLKCA